MIFSANLSTDFSRVNLFKFYCVCRRSANSKKFFLGLFGSGIGTSAARRIKRIYASVGV